MPFFDNSSKHQVDRQHTVWCNPHENNFWIAKSESLELVCPAAPTPDLSIIPCVLSGLGKFCVVLIMCLQPLPQPPRWQSMPRSDTKWHRITVFCRCFRETLCCQLGLGDWLASQSPNQVDSTHGANKNCQPTTKVHYFDNFLGHGPPEYANPGGYVWFCAPDVKHHAQLDNSWSHIMPN